MQKHQRGSVIGFVVVGALLAIAVVGGIYLVKNQLNGNMPVFGNGDDVAVVEDDRDEATDEDSDVNEGSQPGRSTDDQSTTDGDDVTSPDDGDDATVEDEPVDELPADDEAGSDAGVTDDQDDMPQTGVETADELPQTGVGDSLYALLAVGALTASVVAFRRSNSL